LRDYGVVSPKFWIGGTGKALRGNVEAQLVAVYLMTSPHANMIGVFYCPLDTIAKETGLSAEGASKGLQSLIEADFCQFDASTEEVFALRMAAYQVGEQLDAKDNRCKGVAKELERVMSDRLKSAFRAIYSVAFHLPEATAKPPVSTPAQQAPSEPLRSQKQDQKQDQDQKNPSGSTPDKPARRAKGSKRVPDEFLVTDDLKAWAETNAPDVNWPTETDKFRDWEFKHVRTDWAATWRTWMRNAQEKASEHGGRSGPSGAARNPLAGAV
jgi:hypothetical protein